jgi:UDP-4-amino-4,6-dideoxy-N-acetyl-beta-L-altrosamine transaminase
MSIPYGKQEITAEDIRSVVDVLNSSHLTQGAEIPAFEKAISSFVGCKHALAVNSATSALHIACLALEVGEGDLVWTSPITFVATSNAALYCGAEVDFVDIEPSTFNISVDALREKLESAQVLPKVVIVVHMCGQPCDMIEISELSETYGFKVVEDASHAIGSTYGEQKTGSCQYSDIAVFSFHPVKIITTGEGGMATTNDDELRQRMELLRSHGVTRDVRLLERKSEPGWYYEQLALGFNYRITDLQASLGSSQLKRIDSFIQKRHELVEDYYERLSDLELDLPRIKSGRTSSFHLFVIQLVGEERVIARQIRLFDHLRSKDIGVNLHYMPVYKQPYYQKLGFSYNYCPNAEDYYRRAISIPMFPGLGEDDLNIVVDEISRGLK